MAKLFEIPIYALKKNQLVERVDKRITDLRDTQIPKSISEETYKLVIDSATFPQRAYEYNHVVGYIRVEYSYPDINIDLFLPFNRKRYIWYSSRKIWLHNVKLNGFHYYCPGKTTQEISEWLEVAVSDIIQNNIPKQYYADREVFDFINKGINYKVLLSL